MTAGKRRQGKETALRTAAFALRFVLWGLIGLLAARTVWQYVDHRLRPTAYAAQSAPWYTGILVQAVLTCAVLLPCALLLLLLKRKGAGRSAAQNGDDRLNGVKRRDL